MLNLGGKHIQIVFFTNKLTAHMQCNVTITLGINNFIYNNNLSFLTARLFTFKIISTHTKMDNLK